jgi:type IV pilus assembly protein PilM
MTIQPGVWGIDLGQCALKALRLQEIDGQVTATAFDYVEHPKILSQPDADPDQLTREALEKFLSRNTLRGDVVCISVPGQSGLARFVKLPPVEEKKISDIVRFEAKQQIPFNLDEVVWDYQKIGSGVVTDGFAMETEIGLFAMKRDMVNRYLQHFKDVGVDVHIVQMAPLALCNFVAYDLLGKGDKPAEGEEEAAKRTCIVALDIGADASNLIITDADRIIWQRPIPLGGNHFTRALTKDLKLTFAKAEHLKRNATKSPDLKKILASLKPVLNDFVSEVQRSLAFFTNTHRDAGVEYMIGLGNAFRLPGLQRFLSEKLSLEVRKLGKMERMTGDTVVGQQVYTENILSFAVAYGLAVQGLKRARLITNLLPGEIRIERLVKAKKPWAVAAAAALLLGGGALLLSYHLENRPYADPAVKKAEDDAKAAVKKAADAEDRYKKTRAAAEAEEEAVKSIVAGQMERKNWLDLLKFIDDAVPRPDGTNLPPAVHNKYMVEKPAEKGHPTPHDVHSGQEAYGYWKARLQGAKAHSAREAAATSALGRGISDLVQFNIEAIDCRYSDDLAAFWREVTKGVDKNRVRPEELYYKPPEGKGWVIELRGYTFHRDQETFVLETLVENLARLGREAEAAPAAEPGGKPPVAPASPPPGGKPTGKPASMPAGKPAIKVAAMPPGGPIKNQVSHVVLLSTSKKDTDETSTFDLIGSGKVADLARATGGGEERGGGQGTGGGPPGGGPGASGKGMTPGAMTPGGGMGSPQGQGKGQAEAETGPSRDTWTSLLSLSVGGGAAAQRTGGMQFGQPGEGGNAPATPAASPGKPHRTEFVVLFVWTEPTPSDDLRGMGQPADSTGRPR